MRSFVDADDQPDICMLRVARTLTPLVLSSSEQQKAKKTKHADCPSFIVRSATFVNV